MVTNDYWRGGWANNPGLMTQSLPGTQAAMLDQRLGGNYGPVNALADILGAYLQKRSQEGALSYVANQLPKDLDSMTDPAYVQNPVTPERYGEKAIGEALQDLQHTPAANGGTVLTNPDWLHKNDEGLHLNPLQRYADNSPSLIEAARQFAQMNPKIQRPAQASPSYYDLNNAALEKKYANDKLYLTNNGYSDADADALLNQQTEYKGRADAVAFRQNKQEHPEQFVGNTYVGMDENAKQKALQDQAEVAQAKASVLNADPYQLKSGMEQYGFTGQRRPLSYQEIRDKAGQMKAQAMLQLSRKYGMATAQQVAPMIDQAVENRLKDYGGAVLLQQRSQIFNMFNNNTPSTPAEKNQAIMMINEYNTAAEQMGQPGIDMKVMQQLFKNQEIKLTPVDTGGQIHFVAVNANGGPLGRDKNGKPFFTYDATSFNKTPSPKDKMNFALGKARIAETGRHNRASESLSAAKLQETHRHNRTTESISASKTANAGSKMVQKTLQKVGNKLDVMQKAVKSNDHDTAEAMRKELQQMYENGEIDADTWYGEDGLYNTQSKLLSQLRDEE